MEMSRRGGNGCLDVFLGLVEGFALAVSKALGRCGPQQVGKTCLR